MFCLRNQDITDAKAFFYLFFMSNSGNYYFFLDTEGGDDCGWPGIEYGKYTLSANTLTTTEVLFDTNECGGLQDSSNGSKTIASINISNNNLILHPQGEDPVTLQRVK